MSNMLYAATSSKQKRKKLKAEKQAQAARAAAAKKAEEAAVRVLLAFPWAITTLGKIDVC